MNDPLGDNPIDPRTGKPMPLNLNRASIYNINNSTAIRKVKDNDLYKLASPTFFGLPMPRKRDGFEGTWGEGAKSNPPETNFAHTSAKAFSALRNLFPTNKDVTVTGNSPFDLVWRQAAEVGTYDFLDDRFAESEILRINQKEYNIISVKENYINRIVHLSRTDGDGEFNINSVTSFDVQKGETKSRSTWWGGKEKYRNITVTETTESYKDNVPTGEKVIKTYTKEEIIK